MAVTSLRQSLILLGGFELHEETSAAEMVDRLLAMLNQYLISHQHLQLDRTFKVYIKILSSSHSSQKKLTKTTVKKLINMKKVRRFHVGGRRDNSSFSQLWAIDVPALETDNLTSNFKNKCLLTCAILGKLQNEFFMGLNKKFSIVRYVNSTSAIKKKYAGKLLLEELETLIRAEHLQDTGPYEVTSTLTKLSSAWSSQFFIFEGVAQSKSKLAYMYPPSYNDSLMPIFLYKIYNSGHVVFIQNINSYFKHNGKVCFECKRTFKGSRYRHFCKAKKSCFVCHRFIRSSTTYFHSKLEREFCDSTLVPQIASICLLCNCKIFSQSCFRAHKVLCYSRGFFGWFCDTCQTFTYHSNNLCSADIKKAHICGNFRPCRYCFLPNDPHHLCNLKREKPDGFHNRLGFFNLQLTLSNDLILAVIYREEAVRGNFSKHVFFHKNFKSSDTVDRDHFVFNYFDSTKIDSKYQSYKEKVHKKPTFDFSSNLEKIKNKEDSIEKNLLLHFLQPSNLHTTYITMDHDFQIMVICS